MFELSNSVRLILGVIATLAGLIVGLMGNTLGINMLYLLSKRGRKPTSRPFHIWFIFSLSVIVFVIFGSVATFAHSPTPLPKTEFSEWQWLGSSAGCALYFQLTNLGEAEEQLERYNVITRIRDNEYYLYGDVGPYVFTNEIIGNRIPGMDIRLYQNPAYQPFESIGDITNENHYAYFPIYIQSNRSIQFVADVNIFMKPDDFPLFEGLPPPISDPPDDPNVARVYIVFEFTTVRNTVITSEPMHCLDIVYPAQ